MGSHPLEPLCLDGFTIGFLSVYQNNELLVLMESTGVLGVNRIPSNETIYDNSVRDDSLITSICLRIFCYFPLLVLKGIYYYWKCILFLRA